MYYYNSEKNLIDCAIIKVDFTRPSNTYERDGSAVTFSLDYNTKVEDIEETMKFIKTLYSELGFPCSRIYLSGFACLTEGCISTKQQITNHAINEIKKMKNHITDNKLVYKK